MQNEGYLATHQMAITYIK